MKRYFFLILIIALLVVACSRKSVVRKYFVIEPPVDTASVVNDTSSISNAYCEILPTEVAPIFATAQIAVRERSHSVSYFFYHKWAVPPGEAISSFIQREIQRAYLFRRVGQNIWKLKPTYQIDSRIDYLEFIDQQDGAVAHIRMELIFQTTIDQQIRLQHSFEHYVPLKHKDLNEFSRTLSQTLHDELVVFSAKIRDWLLQNDNSL